MKAHAMTEQASVLTTTQVLEAWQGQQTQLCKIYLPA
jgi:hypothetical protein